MISSADCGDFDWGACTGDLKIEERCEIAPGNIKWKLLGTLSRIAGQY